MDSYWSWGADSMASNAARTYYPQDMRIIFDNDRTMYMSAMQYLEESGWEDVKDQIMRHALYAKFTQHSQLTERLLDTDDAQIVEHTKNDSYWGDGGDGTGRNMLGHMLMELRSQLKKIG